MVHGSEIIGQKFNSDHLLNFQKSRILQKSLQNEAISEKI
jgi:hypothetical protein